MFRPYSFAARISAISFDELREAGVAGLIVDLDDTLIGYGLLHPDEQDAAWVAEAIQQGFKLVIVSNNERAWVENVADRFKIRFVHKALKPFPIGFQRALALLGTHRHATAVIGDQVFTDFLGARLLGMRSILTDPLVVRRDFWMRLLRWLERLVTKRPAWPKT